LPQDPVLFEKHIQELDIYMILFFLTLHCARLPVTGKLIFSIYCQGSVRVVQQHGIKQELTGEWYGGTGARFVMRKKRSKSVSRIHNHILPLPSSISDNN